jgi:thymidylate synthase (FAD)
MQVTLQAVTQPVNPEISPADFIAYVARVSNPSNQNNHLTAPKLLAYLVKHKHWSPFEMVNVVMEIETTRDIGRQILRHRSFSFQEFSGRYADPTKALGFEVREARLQDLKNRQNSIEMGSTAEETFIKQTWYELQERLANQTQSMYEWALQHGIAKELARAILPEGMIKSRMYVNGTLRSWIHFCLVRMGPETQKEHREIATSCWKIILEQFPALAIVEVANA